MIDPRMMNAGGIPDMPTVAELWKNEKSKYRHWVILFGIALLALTAISIVSLVLVAVNVDSWAHKINKRDLAEEAANDRLSKDVRSVSEATTLIVTHTILPNAFQVAGFVIGIVLFAKTVTIAYQKKNLGKISNWASFMVGISALISSFNLMQLLWSKDVTAYTTEHPAGIFTIVFYVMSILTWIAVSMPYNRIRKTFMMAERVEAIKADPQYQVMQEQMQAMMSGQPYTPPQPGAAPNPGGPAAGPATGAATGPKPATSNAFVPVEPTISPEEKRLRNMSVTNLKQVAKELSISGYETMKKDELIEAIMRVSK